MLRIVAGLCLAPVVAASFTTVVSSFGRAIPGVGQVVGVSDLDPGFPSTVFVWALMCASAATLLGAAPLFRVLSRRGTPSLPTHILAGAALGVAPFLLLGVLGAVRAASDRDASFLHQS